MHFKVWNYFFFGFFILFADIVVQVLLVYITMYIIRTLSVLLYHTAKCVVFLPR